MTLNRGLGSVYYKVLRILSKARIHALSQEGIEQRSVRKLAIQLFSGFSAAPAPSERRRL